MRYVSTRGGVPALAFDPTFAFDEVLLAGLAEDGGLFVPQTWPRLSVAELEALAGRPYAHVAWRVLRPFVATSLADDVLARICAEAYAGFDHPAVAPLKQLGPSDWLLELFHGPTLAFKDYALQVVGRLFDYVLRARRRHAAVIGATSGDTGSAAIEACRDRESLDIFILHPRGRVSEVQRRQMTTVTSANVHNLAIEGNFDDCQALVKAMFADRRLRQDLNLVAVNSINWARIALQIVYYVYAALALGAPRRRVAFAVPTGNFGNVYAAYAARKIGLPVAWLAIGTNRNDILTRLIETGRMETREVEPSLSPSMDIQVSSNFERLLYDLCGRDGERVAALMENFRSRGALALGAGRHTRLKRLFDAARADDRATLETIARVHRETGEIVDPHTAVGLAAARACRRDPNVAMVALACAHPAKFPDAIEKAIGLRPALPARLADLYRRPERMTTLPNDFAVLAEFVRAHAQVAP